MAVYYREVIEDEIAAMKKKGGLQERFATYLEENIDDFIDNMMM